MFGQCFADLSQDWVAFFIFDFVCFGDNEWVADSSYEDIITLGKALKEGDVTFSDESPKEEPDCPHDNVKLFQSGYKQCQDCKWIWRD